MADQSKENPQCLIETPHDQFALHETARIYHIPHPRAAPGTLDRVRVMIFRSRVHYAVAVAICVVLSLLGAGLLRHHSNPSEHSLGASETYRPGSYAFRTWWQWTAMSRGDFLPIYTTAAGRREDPDFRMYHPEELKQHKAAFVYTPIAALLIAPIVSPERSFEEVADIVSVVNHLLALAGATMLFSLLMRGRPWGAGDVALFLFHVVLFYPLAKALHLTQAGVWMFFLLSSALWLFDRGQRVGSGLALALGCSIKPHLALIPLVLALGGRFPPRTLVACAAGILFCGLACLAYAGPANLVDYTRQLNHLSAGYAYAPNQSFNGLLLRMFTDQDPTVFNLAEPVTWIRVLSTGLGLTLLAFAVWATRRGANSADPDRPLLCMGGVTAAVVVASPVCWIHHLVLLAGPMVLGWRTLVQTTATSSRALTIPLLVGGVLCSVYFDATGAHPLLSGLELYGALMVVGCLLTLAARRR